MNALRAFVRVNYFRKFFMEEKKKKVINILITFSIFYKNCDKTFLI